MAPMTRKRKSLLDAAAEAAGDAPVSPEDSNSRKKLPVRAKDGDVPNSTEPSSRPAKGSLKVFTDDDDAEIVEPVQSAPVKATAPVEENEEDEDSDDEAPEAVSTTKVASEMKKSAQAAQKAAQEQAAEKKRKRQQRDALFKQQAEERKKADDEIEASEKAAAETVAVEEPPAPIEAVGRRRRNDKIQVPALLPAEFLEDPPSEVEDDKLDAIVVRSKKRKIADIEKNLAGESRGPRDGRVGSTVYRVAKKVDERMAPKVSKQSRNSKDLLQKRNRVAGPARRR